MKRIFVLLAVIGVAVFMMLPDQDQKELKNEGKRIKKKLKKSHFPKNEPATA
jgi:hypothetical protein